MGLRATVILAFLLMLVPARTRAFTIELPPPVHSELAPRVVFSRIDSLERCGSVGTEVQRAERAFLLGQLYEATGASKHLETSQRYFEEATRLRPDWLAPAREAAFALARSDYYDLARDRLEAVVARRPGEIAAMLALARIEFVTARRQAYLKDMRAAHQTYLLALRQDPYSREALIGVAATALLTENFALTRSCAERIRELEPTDPDAWFLGAAAAFRLGNVQQAWVEYLRAFALCDAEERGAFLGSRVVITEEDLVRLARQTVDQERARSLGSDGAGGVDWYALVEEETLRAELLERWWTRHDRTPDAFENESEIEFWTRLVEVDLLFARPGDSTRGWETLPGEVWARMGRPRFARFWLAGTALDPSSPTFGGPASGGSARAAGSLTLDPPRRNWDWTYLVDGRPVLVRMSDVGYGMGRWAVGEGSQVDVGVLRNEIAFVEPDRMGPPMAFEIGATIDHFPRGTESILESTVSVRVHDPAGLSVFRPDSLLLDWTLLSADGDSLDHVRRALPPSRLLSNLVARSGQTVGHLVADPRLARIGARVRAGDYQIRIRALDPATGRYCAKTFEVHVPESQTGRAPALSSIQLAHGLPAWDPRGPFPVEFVKHGRVVISAPRAVVEAPKLGVFYEVENLARDGSGNTQFDVVYAIYRGTGKVRLLAMLGEFDPDALEEVELATVQYLHEKTGVSADGLVVKGTEIDISDLREGDYVLRVEIADLIGGGHCAGNVAFRRPAPDRQY